MSRKRAIIINKDMVRHLINKRYGGLYASFLAAHPEIGVCVTTFTAWMGESYNSLALSLRVAAILVAEWDTTDEAEHIAQLRRHLKWAA